MQVELLERVDSRHWVCAEKLTFAGAEASAQDSAIPNVNSGWITDIERPATFGHPPVMEQRNQQVFPRRRPLVLPGAGAVVFAAIFLIAGLYFGSTRDLGAFLLSVPVMGLTFFGALILAIWTSRITTQRRHALVAWMLIVLTVPSYFLYYGLTQQVRFLIWAQAHHDQFAQASRKDGIVTWWNGWGMAGQDTDSYLVVDTADRLASKSRAEQWTREIGQTCGIWQTQRVWPKFYIVATYTNCPYDGVQDTVVK